MGDPPFRTAHTTVASRDPILRSARNLDGLQRLPRSGEEARAVAELFPESRLLLGEEASETELDRLATSGALTGFSTIHLATHALVDTERPDRSGVVLSQVGLPNAFEAAMRGEAVSDGFLSTAEVLARWRLNAELVVLSGCGTGLGATSHGEGFIGLATAFLRVGARTLLVSLWEVDDEATLHLMRSFYRHWRTDEDLGARPKAEALRRARADLRARDARWQHPAHWGAFVLIGDPR